MNLGPRPCIPYSKKYGQEDPIGPRVSESRFSRFPGIIPPPEKKFHTAMYHRHRGVRRGIPIQHAYVFIGKTRP